MLRRGDLRGLVSSMLFNSYAFIFAFLPAVLVGLYLLVWLGWMRAAVWWIGLASLTFYGLGDVRFLALLIVSVIVNYLIGGRIVAAAASSTGSDGSGARRKRRWVATGITANLLTLGFFKYTNFFLSNVTSATGWHIPAAQIVLPIGISFFTFTQIAFLVDCGRGEGHRYRFWDYLLFVSFFPHLVAGPILNHKSILPQVESSRFGTPDSRSVYAAMIFFSIGLFKKVIIADSLSPQVQLLFHNAAGLNFVEAWAGALLYTFQLYYDFSGYSEMAVGLALLINVEIPINFNSPYKSTSIIEFWRRWHISLSSFLRDYLYIPLGGNRRGPVRRYANLLMTMVLGGLWHGAGWTFLAWGTLHGAGLALNHLWRSTGLRLPIVAAWPLTFVFVVVAWVFFRSPDIGTALTMLTAMSGLHGVPAMASLTSGAAFASQWLTLSSLAWIGGLAIWGAIAPNTQEVAFSEQPHPAFAMACALLFSASVMGLDQASEFLYFQF